MWCTTPVLAQLEAAGPGTVVALWVSRLGTYLSVTVLVGLLVAAGWLLRGSGGKRIGSAEARVMRAAAVAAAVWAVAAVGMFFFGLANATARPVAEVLDVQTLGRFLATRYGSGVAVQSAAAVGVCLFAAAARDRGSVRATLLGVAAGVLALASSGHAGTAPVPVLATAASALHILAAAAWVGGLLTVAVLVLPAGTADVRGPTRRFSRLAGWALAGVLATGAVNSLMHVENSEQLLATGWGKLVLLKLALFAGIGVLGWWSRRRWVPRVGRSDGARRMFGRIAAVELVLMAGAFTTATAMASGVPARVEAAGWMEAVRVPFADGEVELTLQPARTGTNELHVYFFDDGGGLREVDDAEVALVRGTETTDVRLVDSGPGHYTGPSVTVAAPGDYRVEVSGRVDGETETATTTFTVR